MSGCFVPSRTRVRREGGDKGNVRYFLGHSLWGELRDRKEPDFIIVLVHYQQLRYEAKFRSQVPTLTGSASMTNFDLLNLWRAVGAREAGSSRKLVACLLRSGLCLGKVRRIRLWNLSRYLRNVPELRTIEAVFIFSLSIWFPAPAGFVNSDHAHFTYLVSSFFLEDFDFRESRTTIGFGNIDLRSTAPLDTHCEKTGLWGIRQIDVNTSIAFGLKKYAYFVLNTA